MAMLGFIINVHITFFFFILDVSCASLPGATAPGDLIIGGLFPIHEDVDKADNSFKPHTQTCIR